jgi:hypothetical protein
MEYTAIVDITAVVKQLKELANAVLMILIVTKVVITKKNVEILFSKSFICCRSPMGSMKWFCVGLKQSCLANVVGSM